CVVRRILLGELEVRRVHHEEVLLACEDDRLLVGRDRRPVRIAAVRRFRRVLVVQHDVASDRVVLEPPLLRLWCSGTCARRAALTPALLPPPAPPAAAAPPTPAGAALRVTASRGVRRLSVDLLAVRGLDLRIARERHAESDLRVVVEEARLVDRQMLRV